MLYYNFFIFFNLKDKKEKQLKSSAEEKIKPL